MRTAAPKDLGWKSIVLPAELGFDDDGGLLELDEVEGVDVVYEDGRVAFKVRKTLYLSTALYQAIALHRDEDSLLIVTNGCHRFGRRCQIRRVTAELRPPRRAKGKRWGRRRTSGSR